MKKWIKDFIEKLFSKKCYYCGENKKQFFWIWEVECHTQVENLSKEKLEICTDCVRNKTR